jgi:hypothetical protein
VHNTGMPEIASYLLFLLAGLYLLVELAGIAAAIEAIMRARTPQGAIAWSLFLVMLPLVALPAYLFLGDRKFSGYIDARRSGDAPLQRLAREINERLPMTLRTRISAEESHPNQRRRIDTERFVPARPTTVSWWQSKSVADQRRSHFQRYIRRYRQG